MNIIKKLVIDGWYPWFIKKRIWNLLPAGKNGIEDLIEEKYRSD